MIKFLPKTLLYLILLIIINQLLESVCLCPKVIQLSGFHYKLKHYQIICLHIIDAISIVAEIFAFDVDISIIENCESCFIENVFCFASQMFAVEDSNRCVSVLKEYDFDFKICKFCYYYSDMLCFLHAFSL